jgi:hypothetical integral membrane protein (TIGR02206 family)
MKQPFVLFGPDHLVALALVVALSAFAFGAGRSGWSEPLGRAGALLVALLGGALWLMRLGDGFQASRDLPIQPCDVVFFLCVICFLKPLTTALAVVVYWGLAGTLQALITPDLLYAFPSKEFFLFFCGHSAIVICVFFLLGRQQPARLAGPQGAGQAFLVLAFYTIVVGGLDAAFGWNYGYLREKPAGHSILDGMGPWPLYVLAALGLAMVLFAVVAGLLRLLWNLSSGVDRGG